MKKKKIPHIFTVMAFVVFFMMICVSCNTTKVSIHDIPSEYFGKSYELSYGPPWNVRQISKLPSDKNFNTVIPFSKSGNGTYDVKIVIGGKPFLFKSVKFEDGTAVINWKTVSETDGEKDNGRVVTRNLDGTWYSRYSNQWGNPTYEFKGNNFEWRKGFAGTGYTGLKGTFEYTQNQIFFTITHAQYSSPRDSYWMPISDVDSNNYSLLGEPFHNRVVSYNFSAINSTNILGSGTFFQLNINGTVYTE